jgi:hypothetical protein
MRLNYLKHRGLWQGGRAMRTREMTDAVRKHNSILEYYISNCTMYCDVCNEFIDQNSF